MKKKILAVILTLAMVMSMLSGCGSKDSSYFKELKEMCKITTGTSVTEMNITYSGDEEYDILKDKDGNQSIKIKYETVNESAEKAGIKISLQLGQEEDYSELTTMVVDEKTIYLTVAPIIDTIKKIDETTAEQVQEYLAQLGISDAVSFDLEQMLSALGTEMPEMTDDSKKQAAEFLNTVIETLEEDFGDAEGQDGDDYTLTFNGDNAETVVDAVVAFLTNDAENLISEYNKIIESLYGADNEITEQVKTMMDEVAAEIPDAAEEVKNSKDDIVNEVKETNLSIVSKAQVSGKEGSRTGKITMETGEIESEGQKVSFSLTSEIKEGEPTIEEMVPENAADITTMLVAMINQMGLMEDEGTYSDLY